MGPLRSYRQPQPWPLESVCGAGTGPYAGTHWAPGTWAQHGRAGGLGSRFRPLRFHNRCGPLNAWFAAVGGAPGSEAPARAASGALPPLDEGSIHGIPPVPRPQSLDLPIIVLSAS